MEDNSKEAGQTGSGLLSAAATVAGSTLLSRIFGFVRDILIARLFGAGVGADTFFVAFRIPNFLRRLFAEGAFSQAFVPVLSGYREQRSLDDVRDLVAHVFGALGLVVAVLSILGVVAAPVLILIFAPGFYNDAPKYAISVQMLRLTFPYIGFISLVAFAGGILNSYGRFGVPAFTPVLLNICLIAAAIGLSPRLQQPEIALAWGVFAAGIVQLLFQLPFLWRLGLLVRPRLALAHAGMRRVLSLMMPALFGVSVSQINLLIDTVLASFLITGSVSWLYYSDRMVEFPLALFGIALATVILPTLSRSYANADQRHFGAVLDWSLRWVLIVVTPAAVGLALLAAPVLCTLFQYGAFTAVDVDMASRSLVAYALGLLGFAAIKVLAPGYFSRQDMRTPVRIGVIAMVTNLILNLALIVPLQHVGLAVATAISAFLNAFLLYRGLRRTRIYNPLGGWTAMIAQVATSTAAMAVVLLLLRGDLESWVAADGLIRVRNLLLLIASGGLVYVGTLVALGMRLDALYLLQPAAGGDGNDAR